MNPGFLLMILLYHHPARSVHIEACIPSSLLDMKKASKIRNMHSKSKTKNILFIPE